MGIRWKKLKDCGDGRLAAIKIGVTGQLLHRRYVYACGVLLCI